MHRVGVFGIASVLVCWVLVVVIAVNPGFKTTVTQSGLDYGRNVGLQYLKQHLSGKVINVPNQSGEKDSIEWSITNIQISNIQIPQGSVAIKAGTGLVISTSAISATLSANWHGREKIWPHPSGSGTATVDISSTSASTTVQMGVNNGHATCSAVDTSASIGHLDIHFSGSHLDFLLNLLKGLFEGAIKNAAEKGMAGEITNEINTSLNNVLSSLPTSVAIGTVADIDFGLVANELFSSSYFTLSQKGEFYPHGSQTEAPFSPAALPDPSGEGAEAQIFVSEYVPNTASYVYYKANQLQGVITHDMVPPTSPIQFNTTSWKSIVPPLYTKYPNYLMQVVIAATKNPWITFLQSKGTQLVATGSITVQVITQSGPVTAFVMGVDATGDATVAVNNGNITAKITFFNSTFSLLSTNIGQFNPKQLEGLLLFAIEGIVVPYVNTYLGVGFPIPTINGLSLVSPKITVNDGYISITTSFNYPPPETATFSADFA